MNKGRLALIGLGVIALAFLSGWLIGGSGRSGAERQAAESQLRLLVEKGRAQLLDARVSLYNVNFGDASRHFESAKPMFEQARERLNSTNRQAEAGILDRVLALVTEAQRMAGALDQGANTKAGEALDALRGLSLPDVNPPAAQ